MALRRQRSEVRILSSAPFIFNDLAKIRQASNRTLLPAFRRKYSRLKANPFLVQEPPICGLRSFLPDQYCVLLGFTLLISNFTVAIICTLVTD